MRTLVRQTIFWVIALAFGYQLMTVADRAIAYQDQVQQEGE